MFVCSATTVRANRIIYSRRIDIHPNTRHQCVATVGWGESVCAQFDSDSRCATTIILFHLGCVVRPQHRFISSSRARAMQDLNGANGKKQKQMGNCRLSICGDGEEMHSHFEMVVAVVEIPLNGYQLHQLVARNVTINFEEEKRNCRFGGCNFRSSGSSCKTKREFLE